MKSHVHRVTAPPSYQIDRSPPSHHHHHLPFAPRRGRDVGAGLKPALARRGCSKFNATPPNHNNDPLSRELIPSPSQGEIQRGSQGEGNGAAKGRGHTTPRAFELGRKGLEKMGRMGRGRSRYCGDGRLVVWVVGAGFKPAPTGAVHNFRHSGESRNPEGPGNGECACEL